MAASALRVRNLFKEFSSIAEHLSILEDVSFDLVAGEKLSIVGASGSGKSTLLTILGTLDVPTSGRVELDEVDPFTLPSTALAAFRNTKIGFVFQEHHLLPQLSVMENVLLPALATGRPSPQAIERAAELIDAVGLSDRRRHIPSQLSGGERQRTAVARALLHCPKLILADEPTGNLDAGSSEKVAELLFDLPARQGAMLILATHSVELAQRAERQMRIESRRLVEG